MFWFGIITLASNAVDVIVVIPTPLTNNRIEFSGLDKMVTETKNLVITNELNKIHLTDLELDRFNEIIYKFINGSITINKIRLQLCEKEKFKDVSFILSYIFCINYNKIMLKAFSLLIYLINNGRQKKQINVLLMLKVMVIQIQNQVLI